MTAKPLAFITSALFITIFSATNLAFAETNKTSKIKEQLKKEFKGAYHKKVKKTNRVRQVNLTAKPSEIEIIKGYKTAVWAYNDAVPGAVIRINLGDTLKINFKNQLPEATTVHFHGVRVPNAMDGVPGVTQAAVEPKDGFLYEFKPKDAGTFWFHPHLKTNEQMDKGLYGVLIVEDKNSKKYSKDLVWVLDDWRLNRKGAIVEDFNNARDLSHDGRWGNFITANSKPREKLVVQPGMRVLLRVINSSNARLYKLDLGKLQKYAVAVAVDGMKVKKVFNPQGFDLAPGNRIDLDITLPANSAGEKFSIKDIYTEQPNMLGTIEVLGKTVKTPKFEYALNTKIPDWQEAKAIKVDKNYDLNNRGGMMMGMMHSNAKKDLWMMDGKSFPSYDPLNLKSDNFYKIRFTNKSFFPHPMHIHGMFFKVLSRNDKPVDGSYFQDTVLVYPNEVVDIGVIPMDKGNWVNHCHILAHAEMGMLTVIKVE